MAEKKEFKWDVETKIGGFGDDKKRHEVFVCELNGKQFVQMTKEVFTVKNGWKRTKGNTMPLADFEELQSVLFNAGMVKAPKKVKATKK